MNPEFKDAMDHGQLVKTQTFITARGTYILDYFLFKYQIYLFKRLNGKLVECCNLNKVKGETGNE